MLPKNIPYINNFDLIRLLAAIEVVFIHAIHHLKIDGWPKLFADQVIVHFPGVPIFFTVSGFLIFWAFDRKPNLKQYFINRILRLYPALYVCLLITIALLLINSSLLLLSDKGFYLWIAAQTTFFQFYTPESVRFWGVGTPNGSLWTITVELQFYLMVPIIYYLIKCQKSNKVLILFFLISLVLNFLVASLTENSLTKLFFVSVTPYLFNFLIGTISYIYWEKLRDFIENKFLIWLSIYLIYCVFFGNFLGFDLRTYALTNILQVFSQILLGILTLSFAFSFNNLSQKTLKHNDISYGVYIYHMLVVNSFVSLALLEKTIYLTLVLAITIIMATISWVFIEKPALRLKNRYTSQAQ